MSKKALKRIIDCKAEYESLSDSQKDVYDSARQVGACHEDAMDCAEISGI
jgi:hypothetical protein